MEGEAASCSRSKSQKAFLCLSVSESFILTAARTNNIRLNSVLFISPRMKEDKQTVMFSSVSLHHMGLFFFFFFIGAIYRFEISLEIPMKIKWDYLAGFVISARI